MARIGVARKVSSRRRRGKGSRNDRVASEPIGRRTAELQQLASRHALACQLCNSAAASIKHMALAI
jgi:hypothetical protein